jgi:hypothetical protein
VVGLPIGYPLHQFRCQGRQTFQEFGMNGFRGLVFPFGIVAAMRTCVAKLDGDGNLADLGLKTSHNVSKLHGLATIFSEDLTWTAEILGWNATFR